MTECPRDAVIVTLYIIVTLYAFPRDAVMAMSYGCSRHERCGSSMRDDGKAVSESLRNGRAPPLKRSPDKVGRAS